MAAQKDLDPFGVQPRCCAGLSNEGDGASHTKLGVEFFEVLGETGQGVEQVGQAHQIVVTLHGIPVQGKGMLILVTLVFFHQEAGLDAPAISCAKIAALMDIVVIEGATGNPGMTSGFWNDLSFITHFLPTLFADHNVEVHLG